MIQRFCWLLSWTLGLSTGLAAPAMADETQPLAAIRTAAEQHVRTLLAQANGKYFVTAGHLDGRLRLKACAGGLQGALPVGATLRARMTVEVRCPDPAWSVYIPVNVEVEAPVLVLKRAVNRDEHVTAADVQIQTLRLPGTGSGYVAAIEQLQQQHMKRPLAAGEALTAEVLVPDLLVRRGQQVTLLASTGQIEIRAQGKALNDGGVHQRIRVQNLTSMKIVEGTVESADLVRVGSQ